MRGSGNLAGNLRLTFTSSTKNINALGCSMLLSQLFDTCQWWIVESSLKLIYRLQPNVLPLPALRHFKGCSGLPISHRCRLRCTMVRHPTGIGTVTSGRRNSGWVIILHSDMFRVIDLHWRQWQRYRDPRRPCQESYRYMGGFICLSKRSPCSH